jgi:uncharacterized alpha-E superfamily protein
MDDEGRDEERGIFDRMVEATEGAVSNLGREVSQMGQRAQQAARAQLQLATADDVARMQASLDRIEAAVNDLHRRLDRLDGPPGTGPIS